MIDKPLIVASVVTFGAALIADVGLEVPGLGAIANLTATGALIYLVTLGIPKHLIAIQAGYAIFGAKLDSTVDKIDRANVDAIKRLVDASEVLVKEHAATIQRLVDQGNTRIAEHAETIRRMVAVNDLRAQEFMEYVKGNGGKREQVDKVK